MSGLPAIEPYPLPTADSLPARVPPWAVDPARAVLLLHDLQRYFLRPIPEPLRGQLIANAAELVNWARGKAVPVAYTAQPGGMTPQQRGLLKDFWGPGMRVDPADREVVEPVAPRDGDWLLTKWRYSAFFNSDLLKRMRDAGRDQLVVCGIYAHVGVLATCVESYTHDIETFLVADAVADFGERDHRMALEYAARTCAVVLPTKEVLA
ncbi:isochorismatase family protein [Streptomyces roseirectus]|uniref:Isochorismatase family protein n=1 Tax=Streptomyces roseirectus TaxID=2768066 RepID=A0A7H0ICC1_9ACTN|nr:isochorismatase family protein [Streptomyces roseirectus]QNP70437.1 isochorismatase family protein [Streptomyces roseirectus]